MPLALTQSTAQRFTEKWELDNFKQALRKRFYKESGPRVMVTFDEGETSALYRGAVPDLC